MNYHILKYSLIKKTLGIKMNYLNNYNIDTKSGVYIPSNYDPSTFVYSDGDESEKYLIDSILSTKDLSSNSYELSQKIKDWVSMYHLSPRRSNLLRPLKNKLQGKILEIGAGCGAITRYLGEVSEQVIAVEGSIHRASIARLRCRDQENVTLICDNISNFQSNEKFDVVTLIGVLEYSRIYFPSLLQNEDPVISLLKFAKTFLNHDGILIIAIENKLGLKYFAGYPEDHLGESMAGIEGLYNQKSVVTFGKVELKEIIKKAGYNTSTFYYPFPDYKVPTSVLCEDLIQFQDKINLSYIPQTSETYDPQRPEFTTFNLNLVWEEVYKNKLWGDLSNSFLVLASDKNLEEKNIAYHYSIDRIKKFQKEITFSKDLKVHKTFLNKIESTPDEYAPFTLTLKDEEFVNGENWESKLHRILNTPGWTFAQLEEWLTVWMQCIAKTISYQGDKIPLTYELEGKYLDAIPRNLIVTKDGFKFIDLEWSYVGSITFQQLLFRCVFTSFFSNRTINLSGVENFTDIKNWNIIKKVFLKIGYWLDNQFFLASVENEMDFQTIIIKNYNIVKITEDWLNSVALNRVSYKGYFEKDKVIQDKNIALDEKDKVVQNKNIAILAYRFSYSFRVGYYLLHFWKIPYFIFQKLKFLR
jgi:SAM-dependent methyltransferase